MDKFNDNDMKIEAENALIDSEGNKFKAIKIFRDVYNVDNEVALKYITEAYNKINNVSNEKDNSNQSNEKTNPVKEIVDRNGGKNIQSIREVREMYNCNLEVAMKLIDEAMNSMQKNETKISDPIEEIVKNNNYDELRSIKEVREKYGYSMRDAMKIVRDVLSLASIKGDNPNAIKQTIIVSQDSTKSATSIAGRGIIGEALLGPVGLLAGGLSAKSNNRTTFQIIYNNGKQETKTVDNDSSEFKEYCKYLK